jgi:hypothetical protein
VFIFYGVFHTEKILSIVIYEGGEFVGNAKKVDLTLMKARV